MGKKKLLRSLTTEEETRGIGVSKVIKIRDFDGQKQVSTTLSFERILGISMENDWTLVKLELKTKNEGEKNIVIEFYLTPAEYEKIYETMTTTTYQA